jgi:hypothetical protein
VGLSEFKALRLSRTSVITLNASLDQVFPLFGPMREMEWAEGWQPEIVYGQAEQIEEHMVFKTKAHGHGEPDYTWTVSKYAPDQALIEYTVFTPERLWTITIQCRPAATPRATQAEITYTYTGLTKHGNTINAWALHAMYAHDLKDWEAAINHYLETGLSIFPST